MTVHLVGAGPGDPGLITVRGREVLEAAEVVVYDRLSAEALLDLAPADAERINVGKAPGNVRMDQDAINALLVERGRSGRRVVRLKGGDPFVFARGGEEARALIAAGVAFEVVPGITSAIAAPAYAGIPVTMRHSSTSLTVVTGHEDPTHPESVDWDALAKVGGTLVILMGVARLARIVERLLDAGMSPSTPAAAVTWGTRPEQRTVRTTLAGLTGEPIESPATIVVGEVAAIDVGWLADARPLVGRTVVVAGTHRTADELGRRFGALGARAVVLPVITDADPADGGAALGAAARRIRDFTWVVFTSPVAVRRTFAHLRDARDLAGVQVAAVGPSTAKALRRNGVEPDIVPDDPSAEAMSDLLPVAPPGGTVLFPRADRGRDVVPEVLAGRGWVVEAVEAYRTVTAEPDPTLVEEAVDADALVVTSGSAVEAAAAWLGAGALAARPVHCMGPTAAEALARMWLGDGAPAPVVADPHTLDALVDGVVTALRSG